MPFGGPDSYRGGRRERLVLNIYNCHIAQLAELVDALVSNTCGKPCRFDSGTGYVRPLSNKRPFLILTIWLQFTFYIHKN